MREQQFVQNGLGYMTNMATMPIYDKNALKIFSRARGKITSGFGM